MKDFDLNLKVEKSVSKDADVCITSMVYCTSGCLTGNNCGTSECGATQSCLGSWLCY